MRMLAGLVGLATAALLVSTGSVAAAGQQPAAETPSQPLTADQLADSLSGPDLQVKAVGFDHTRVLVLGPQRPAREVAQQFCELTDSLLGERRRSGSTKVEWTVERRARTRNLEAAWNREVRLRFFQRTMQRAERIQRGEDVGQPSSSAEQEADLLVVGGSLPLLRQLTPEEWGALASETPVQITPERVSQEPARAFADALATQVRPWLESGDPKREAEARDLLRGATQQYQRYGTEGVTITPSLDGHANGRELLIHPPQETQLVGVLLSVPDDVLALPVQGRNPYRWMERPASTASQETRLPAALLAPLEKPLAVPGDGTWRSTVQALCRAARFPGISDDYLSRPRSRPGRWGRHSGRVLALRGATMKSALDEAGRLFGYVWWEKGGCLYFRSNTWIRDGQSEVPPSFLNRWQTAAAAGRIGQPELEALLSLTGAQREGVTRLTGVNEGGTEVTALARSGVRQVLEFLSALSPTHRSQVTGDGAWFATADLADVPFTRRIVHRKEGLYAGRVRVRVLPEISRVSVTPPAWRIDLKVRAERYDRDPTRATGGRFGDFMFYIPLPGSAADRTPPQ